MKVIAPCRPGAAEARLGGPNTRRLLLLPLVLVALTSPVSARPVIDGDGVTLAAGASGRTAPAPPGQNAITLTLDEVIGLAEGRSEEIALAAEDVTRAGLAVERARAERTPLVTGSALYTRTLKSEFEGLFGGNGAGDCQPLLVNPGASLEARVAELERAYDCPRGFSFGEDVRLPFGQANAWRLNVDFSQVLYAGGRIETAIRQARVARELASDTLVATRAQLVLDAVTAALDAALLDRLVTITEEARDQARRALDNARARREVGWLSEFELLRAQVALDAFGPELIRRRAARDLAYLRLKQLLQLPATTDLRVAIDLEEDRPVTDRYRLAIAEAEMRLAVPDRLALSQARRGVDLADLAIAQARAQRRPTVALTSGLGVVSYPDGWPVPDEFRTNWTVGVVAQVPLFTGGRIATEVAMAQSAARRARLELALAREYADLEAEDARQVWLAARATLEATTSSVALAQRAYDIADLRFREGLSTQLELSDARLQLQQARTDRAAAMRTLHVARFRLALLPDLPVRPATAGAPATPAAALGGLAMPASPSATAFAAAVSPAAGASR